MKRPVRYSGIRAAPSPREEARDDATLVRDHLAGDPEAAGGLFDRYAGLVRGIARRSLASADVDDVLQEVFLHFFGSLKRIRDPSQAKSFLVGICVKRIRTELRRRRATKHGGDVVRAALEPDTLPGGSGSEVERQEIVRRVFDSLPDETRVLFVMRWVEGMEVAEIASALRVSHSTAKRRLVRAAKRVQAKIASDPALSSWSDAL